MSQNELACVGKVVIAAFGYFISTGLIGAAMAWIVGGIAFTLLAMCE